MLAPSARVKLGSAKPHGLKGFFSDPCATTRVSEIRKPTECTHSILLTPRELSRERSDEPLGHEEMSLLGGLRVEEVSGGTGGIFEMMKKV